MRKGGGDYPEAFSEYEKAISLVCTKTAKAEHGFIYESAKDTLKWHDLDVKELVFTVMSIGNLLYLDDKNFNKFKDDNSYADITKEELSDIYKEYNLGKDKNRDR